MNRRILALGLCTLFGVALLTGGTLLTGGRALAAEPTTKPGEMTIKGTCSFGGTKGTWSGKLTPKGDGTYDASYQCKWGNGTLLFAGTVKTDLKTAVSGMGKATGGGANGTFEFSGKFGADGTAKCPYKEVGGRGRSGSLTVDSIK